MRQKKLFLGDPKMQKKLFLGDPKMQNKWWKRKKKVIFQWFFQGFIYMSSFLHKLHLQQGQKQKNFSLLEFMALVVSVTAT